MTESSTSRAVELAPSKVKVDELLATRIVAGLGGLFLTTVGIVSVIANQYREGKFWIPEGIGYITAAFGVALLVFLAIRDSDYEIRRVFGFLGAALLVTAVVVSLIPGKPENSQVEAALGYRLLPWGLLAGLGGLVFLVPFVRNETEPGLKNAGTLLLLGTGSGLSVLAVVLAFVQKETLLLQVPVLAVLGLAYLAGFFAEKGAETGLGYFAGLGLGILGTAVLAVALGLSIAPAVLSEGPSALKTATQSYDPWKLASRIVLILGGLAGLWAFRLRSWPLWVRSGVAGLGIAWAGLFLMASFMAMPSIAVKPYFVPFGVILAAIGLLQLVIAIGLVSESQFVVLTRRELSSYIYTPIGYIILIGMAGASAAGYYFFLEEMLGQGRSFEEPIVRGYPAFGVWAALQCLFLVPAITMRAFSEEKRTGTLEVLLTAPVPDATILLSKFAACWSFFMLSWLPAGLYLIALRVVGGQPFDFKPLLSYYLAVGVAGVSFVGVGIFFSSLTRNQIVAAVLTAAWMFLNLLTVLLPGVKSDALSPGVRAALAKLDFLSLWNQALGGSLPVADAMVQASIGVFFLFLALKVLEIRKWS
jgi:hypothetical protein